MDEIEKTRNLITKQLEKSYIDLDKFLENKDNNNNIL